MSHVYSTDCTLNARLKVDALDNYLEDHNLKAEEIMLKSSDHELNEKPWKAYKVSVELRNANSENKCFPDLVQA